MGEPEPRPRTARKTPEASRVSYEKIEKELEARGAGVKRRNLLPLIGRELALYILGLMVVVLVLVSLYAWMTFPTPGSLNGLVPAEKLYESYREQRTAWFLEVKGLLELLVVSILVPLFATVIGYLFGRHELERERDER
jgi:hypothetical protein